MFSLGIRVIRLEIQSFEGLDRTDSSNNRTVFNRPRPLGIYVFARLNAIRKLIN
jgi:hypothetical protein